MLSQVAGGSQLAGGALRLIFDVVDHLVGHLVFSLVFSTPWSALATVAVVSLLVVIAVSRSRRSQRQALSTGPDSAGGAALRDRSESAAFVPQRDPDASGRPRPRAP